MLEAVVREFRFAARALRRRRALTVAAVVTLALGIGVNAAIFSLVRAVLLRLRSGTPHAADRADVGPQIGVRVLWSTPFFATSGLPPAR